MNRFKNILFLVSLCGLQISLLYASEEEAALLAEKRSALLPKPGAGSAAGHVKPPAGAIASAVAHSLSSESEEYAPLLSDADTASAAAKFGSHPVLADATGQDGYIDLTDSRTVGTIVKLLAPGSQSGASVSSQGSLSLVDSTPRILNSADSASISKALNSFKNRTISIRTRGKNSDGSGWVRDENGLKYNFKIPAGKTIDDINLSDIVLDSIFLPSGVLVPSKEIKLRQQISSAYQNLQIGSLKIELKGKSQEGRNGFFKDSQGNMWIFKLPDPRVSFDESPSQELDVQALSVKDVNISSVLLSDGTIVDIKNNGQILEIVKFGQPILVGTTDSTSRAPRVQKPAKSAAASQVVSDSRAGFAIASDDRIVIPRADLVSSSLAAPSVRDLGKAFPLSAENTLRFARIDPILRQLAEDPTKVFKPGNPKLDSANGRYYFETKNIPILRWYLESNPADPKKFTIQDLLRKDPATGNLMHRLNYVYDPGKNVGISFESDGSYQIVVYKGAITSTSGHEMSEKYFVSSDRTKQYSMPLNVPLELGFASDSILGPQSARAHNPVLDLVSDDEASTFNDETLKRMHDRAQEQGNGLLPLPKDTPESSQNQVAASKSSDQQKSLSFVGKKVLQVNFALKKMYLKMVQFFGPESDFEIPALQKSLVDISLQLDDFESAIKYATLYASPKMQRSEASLKKAMGQLRYFSSLAVAKHQDNVATMEDMKTALEAKYDESDPQHRTLFDEYKQAYANFKESTQAMVDEITRVNTVVDRNISWIGNIQRTLRTIAEGVGSHLFDLSPAQPSTTGARGTYFFKSADGKSLWNFNVSDIPTGKDITTVRPEDLVQNGVSKFKSVAFKSPNSALITFDPDGSYNIYVYGKPSELTEQYYMSPDGRMQNTLPALLPSVDSVSSISAQSTSSKSAYVAPTGHTIAELPDELESDIAIGSASAAVGKAQKISEANSARIGLITNTLSAITTPFDVEDFFKGSSQPVPNSDHYYFQDNSGNKWFFKMPQGKTVDGSTAVHVSDLILSGNKFTNVLIPIQEGGDTGAIITFVPGGQYHIGEYGKDGSLFSAYVINGGPAVSDLTQTSVSLQPTIKKSAPAKAVPATRDSTATVVLAGKAISSKYSRMINLINLKLHHLFSADEPDFIFAQDVKAQSVAGSDSYYFQDKQGYKWFFKMPAGKTVDGQNSVKVTDLLSPAGGMNHQFTEVMIPLSERPSPGETGTLISFNADGSYKIQEYGVDGTVLPTSYIINSSETKPSAAAAQSTVKATVAQPAKIPAATSRIPESLVVAPAVQAAPHKAFDAETLDTVTSLAQTPVHAAVKEVQASVEPSTPVGARPSLEISQIHSSDHSRLDIIPEVPGLGSSPAQEAQIFVESSARLQLDVSQASVSDGLSSSLVRQPTERVFEEPDVSPAVKPSAKKAPVVLPLRVPSQSAEVRRQTQTKVQDLVNPASENYNDRLEELFKDLRQARQVRDQKAVAVSDKQSRDNAQAADDAVMQKKFEIMKKLADAGIVNLSQPVSPNSAQQDFNSFFTSNFDPLPQQAKVVVINPASQVADQQARAPQAGQRVVIDASADIQLARAQDKALVAARKQQAVSESNPGQGRMPSPDASARPVAEAQEVAPLAQAEGRSQAPEDNLFTADVIQKILENTRAQIALLESQQAESTRQFEEQKRDSSFKVTVQFGLKDALLLSKLNVLSQAGQSGNIEMIQEAWGKLSDKEKPAINEDLFKQEQKIESSIVKAQKEKELAAAAERKALVDQKYNALNPQAKLQDSDFKFRYRDEVASAQLEVIQRALNETKDSDLLALVEQVDQAQKAYVVAITPKSQSTGELLTQPADVKKAKDAGDYQEANPVAGKEAAIALAKAQVAAINYMKSLIVTALSDTYGDYATLGIDETGVAGGNPKVNFTVFTSDTSINDVNSKYKKLMGLEGPPKKAPKETAPIVEAAPTQQTFIDGYDVTKYKAMKVSDQATRQFMEKESVPQDIIDKYFNEYTTIDGINVSKYLRAKNDEISQIASKMEFQKSRLLKAKPPMTEEAIAEEIQKRELALRAKIDTDVRARMAKDRISAEVIDKFFAETFDVVAPKVFEEAPAIQGVVIDGLTVLDLIDYLKKLANGSPKMPIIAAMRSAGLPESEIKIIDDLSEDPGPLNDTNKANIKATFKYLESIKVANEAAAKPIVVEAPAVATPAAVPLDSDVEDFLGKYQKYLDAPSGDARGIQQKQMKLNGLKRLYNNELTPEQRDLLNGVDAFDPTVLGLPAKPAKSVAVAAPAAAPVVTLSPEEQSGVDDFLGDLYDRASKAGGVFAARVKSEAVNAYKALNDNQRAVLNANAEFDPVKIGLPAKEAQPVAVAAPAAAPLDSDVEAFLVVYKQAVKDAADVGPMIKESKFKAAKQLYIKLSEDQRQALSGVADFNKADLGRIPVAKAAAPAPVATAVASIAGTVASAESSAAQPKPSLTVTDKYADLPPLPPSPGAVGRYPLLPASPDGASGLSTGSSGLAVDAFPVQPPLPSVSSTASAQAVVAQ